MTCEQFQARLPEFYEEGIDIERHPHVQTCVLCRALIKDLESIARDTRYHNREAN
jgi:hypothetical protein